MVFALQLDIKTTTTTMDDVILLESEDSENSIVELEVPKKPTPPLIEIEDEELILNIMGKNQRDILAKDFIKKDTLLSSMPTTAESSLCSNSPNHWTKDMIRFYDDDWGDEENFIVEKLQDKMDKTSSLWKISRKDILHMQNKIRHSNIKCWNCNQKGHHVSLCPEPPHVPKCHMCGTEGHVEYACPNSKCLNCGNQSREYVTRCNKCRTEANMKCSRCKIIGHNFINCPDHWRLFHLTTCSTSVIIPCSNVHKPSKEIWCCNCGKKGHYQIECLQRKDCGGFKDTLPFVISYHKAFEHKHPKQHSKPEKSDVIPKKKHKQIQDEENKIQKTLRINPMHKAILNNKNSLKNKLKRFKKFKRNRRKRKGFFDSVTS